MSELDSVNSRELMDFAMQSLGNSADVTAKPHHKVLSVDELDRLAGKNSAESTIYQTKWATAVMKGM